MNPKDYKELEPLLSDRARLAIMATLAAQTDPFDFTTLCETLELSKGNLSSHLRKLEDAKLVKVTKEFIDRKPRTTYNCTALGRRTIQKYLTAVEIMLKATKG